ncbi:MAG: TolC family protein [Synergistaceae bacterium]|nr:TolC family protein [Synergistaceae bacterium]
MSLYRFSWLEWGKATSFRGEAAVLTIVVVLLLVRAGPCAAEDAGSQSLERCIEVALSNRPSLIESRSGIESQKARVGQAAASLRPQVRVSPSYGYSRSESAGGNGQFAMEFSLNQTISDWGRTDLSIQGARQELEAKVLDEGDTVQAIVADVSDAYYALGRSGQNLEVADERVGIYESRLNWAKDFYKAGSKAKIEVTKAETDLANARLDYVLAQGALQRAVSGLAHSMGTPDWSPDDAVGFGDSLDEPEAFLDDGTAISMDDAVAAAMSNRSDMKAQDVRVDAARTNLLLAAKELSPTLTGGAGYSFSGEDDPFENREWRVSLGLSVPVADGGLARERTRQAEGDLAAAEARWETMRQDVIYAVRTAYTSLIEARESVLAAKEAERQAGETLKLAQGRYKAGVGESLEISDAVDGYAQSRIRVVTALYNLKSAEIALKRVMGVIAK